MMQINCGTCGTPIPQGAPRCPRCGTPVLNEPPHPSQTRPDWPMLSEKERKRLEKDWKKWHEMWEKDMKKAGRPVGPPQQGGPPPLMSPQQGPLPGMQPSYYSQYPPPGPGGPQPQFQQQPPPGPMMGPAPPPGAPPQSHQPPIPSGQSQQQPSIPSPATATARTAIPWSIPAVPATRTPIDAWSAIIPPAAASDPATAPGSAATAQLSTVRRTARAGAADAAGSTAGTAAIQLPARTTPARPGAVPADAVFRSVRATASCPTSDPAAPELPCRRRGREEETR